MPPPRHPVFMASTTTPTTTATAALVQARSPPEPTPAESTLARALNHAATNDPEAVKQNAADLQAIVNVDQLHPHAANSSRPKRSLAELGRARARQHAQSEATSAASKPKLLHWPDMCAGLELTRPDLAPRVRLYNSPPDPPLMELEWRRSDGIKSLGSLRHYLPPWLLLDTHLPVIVTLVQIGATWVPWTVAAESTHLPGELGLFPLRRFIIGELVVRLRGRRVGTYIEHSNTLHKTCVSLLKGRRSSDLFSVRVGGGRLSLWDGWHDRPGGGRCANDPKGLGVAAMAVAWQADLDDWSEDAVLRAVRPIPAVNPTTTREGLASRELLWNYGASYWA